MPRIPRAAAMRPSRLPRVLGMIAAPVVLLASAVGLLAALGAYLAFLALIATAYGLSEVAERLRRLRVQEVR